MKHTRKQMVMQRLQIDPMLLFHHICILNILSNYKKLEHPDGIGLLVIYKMHVIITIDSEDESNYDAIVYYLASMNSS